jgi:hypothetical protein
MRLVAVVAGQDTSFTWAGTLGIVISYTLPLLPGAVAAAATSRRARWIPLLGGVGLLAWASASISLSGEIEGELSAWQVAGVGLVLALFAALLVAQATAIVRLGDRRRR